MKILKLSKPFSDSEVKAAESAVDTLGVNTRLTLPTGFELEVDRSPSGYDVLNLIEHHDTQMALSAMAQAMQIGTKQKYAYPYGSGNQMQGEFLAQVLASIMKSMEDTLNEWAVAPLVDWNFGSGNYPKIKFMPVQDETQSMIYSIFSEIIKKDPTMLTPKYIASIANSVSDRLGLDAKINPEKDAILAFETGKKAAADALKKPAPPTPKVLKEKIAKKAVALEDDPGFEEKFKEMGKEYAINFFKQI